MQMTPEQKQIAIAEFEGWKIIDVPFMPNQLSPDDKTCFTRKALAHWKGMTVKQLPLYLTSREAICGAVGRLDKARLAAFAAKLEDVVFSSKSKPFKEGDSFGYIELPPEDITAMILATPAQMADALLLTLGFEV
jgi:hypothetical protein